MKFQSEGCINILIELILAIKLKFELIPLLAVFCEYKFANCAQCHNGLFVWCLHTHNCLIDCQYDYRLLESICICFFYDIALCESDKEISDLVLKIF